MTTTTITWIDALRAIERERDDLRAEVDRLRAGGCARDQRLTQYCAEAEALKEENARIKLANIAVVCEVEALLEARAGVIDTFAENEKLRAEVDELRADAERWRYLRASNQYKPWWAQSMTPDELTAAIDAARKA